MMFLMFTFFDFVATKNGDGFQFLTYWGFSMTALTYLLFMVEYGVRFYQIGKAQLKTIKQDKTVEVKETYSLWHFISWASSLCFIVNIVITALYWFGISLEKNRKLSYLNYIFHIAPFVATGVDFILNLVVVELNLVVWTELFIWIYGVINFVWVKYVIFKPVYTLLTWTSLS